MPDFDREFILQTDASGILVSAQLLQEYNGVKHPVAYASRLLNKHEVNKSTVELECIGIVVFGLSKFQQYLEHREFHLNTGNSAFTFHLNHPRESVEVAHLYKFLQCKLTDIPANKNAMADLLSRTADCNEATAVAFDPDQLEDLS